MTDDSSPPDPKLVPPDPKLDLSVLGPDGEKAYLDIRAYVVRRLEWKGCQQPEEVADDAILRGLLKIGGGTDVSQSGPRAFIWGIAKNVMREGWRRDQRHDQLDPGDVLRTPSVGPNQAGVDARLLLDQALQQLDERSRNILLSYLTEPDHSQLCDELGVTPANLRVIVHRIREALRGKWPDPLSSRRGTARGGTKKSKGVQPAETSEARRT